MLKSKHTHRKKKLYCIVCHESRQLKMSLRFIVISSLLFFVIANTLFASFHCKGGNDAGFVAASDKEARPKNVYIVAAAASARERTLKGRKMVVHMAKGKQTSFIGRTTLSGNKNVNFVAYTEDYGRPKHHPPKNN